MGDVLTFYQERIANEGYLRTATERRSILELARLVGYALRPGVASTVFLAYTLDDSQAGPVEIPAGARSQSIPGPGELPQSFETSEKLIARSEWNNLQVRRTRPQNIAFETVLTRNTIYVAGTNVNLKTGDQLLLVFSDKDNSSVVRTVAKAEGQFADDRTEIQLEPLPPATLEALRALKEFIKTAEPLVSSTESGKFLVGRGKEILDGIYLGLLLPPEQWAESMRHASRAVEEEVDQEIESAFGDFQAKVEAIVSKPPSPPPAAVVTDPSKFVTQLLQPPIPQAASSLQLSRSLKVAFREGADVHPQLLVNFAPQLKDTFYTAWSSADVNGTPSPLKGVFAFRVEAPLFGASVPDMASYNADNKLKKPSEWDKWPLADDETNDALFLDQAYDAILPASYVMIQQNSNGLKRQVKQVNAAQTTQRTAYGISGKTTQLTFADPWRDEMTDLTPLRTVLVYGQSESLRLIEEPITTDVDKQEITLDEIYNDLTSGRWVIFSGERADIPGVTGVKASELLMISGLQQDFDSTLPGDKTRTTLILATPPAYSYKRGTLTIYGNVVKATHGETRNETLGSGDGSQALQSFALKQPPLTFVPAPTPAGVDSTLKVCVNNVEWHEADTLAGLGPKDRKFITQDRRRCQDHRDLRQRQEGCAAADRRGERDIGLSQRDRQAGQRALPSRSACSRRGRSG